VEVRDLIVTPVWIIIIYAVAFVVRPRVTDEVNRVYFIPALTVKIVGALAVGLIYQFYYGGGDTFNYHTHGSRHVWEAFMDSPAKWFKLVFGDGVDETGIYKYSSRIVFWRDQSSYAVVRVASFIDVFTFSTYSATAVLFAVFSFAGMWLLFITFYGSYPELHKQLAIAMFFIPSVFFWGSGLLKDTLTLGCLGMATFALNRIFVQHRLSIMNLLLLSFAFIGLYEVKIYILLVFLPSVILWLFLSNLQSVRSMVLKSMLFPIVISGAIAIAYFAMIKASEDNVKYSVGAIAKTAQSTAYDILYYTGRDAGSGYSLGELDGSFGSMIRLAPQAINVSLFRPYLWEVNNPFMLLSCLESTVLMLFTVVILFRENTWAFRAIGRPDIFFALTFSVTFAFAVGVSTYNFGTLVRYKIPLLPFFALALILIADYSKRERNEAVLEFTE
jgi:hypothetical protein